MAPNFNVENMVLEDKEIVSTPQKYVLISRYYDNGKTIAFIEMNSTEYIRNFDQYVDEFSTLEETDECLQECLSA